MKARAGCVVALGLSLALVLAAPRAIRAGSVWTDANGDGLPDAPGTLVASTGDVVSVDVWIDSQSFAWTNFLVYAEWTPGRFQFLSGQYRITGGQNFPVDDFTHPSGVGFGGAGYDRQGIDRMATIDLRVLSGGACCVTPIIDVYNPYYAFCQLGSGAAYLLFTSNPNSCWTVGAVPEACCFADATCSMLTPDECSAAGGTPQGLGTDCASVVCELPPPRGACCLPSGACTDSLTAPECAATGGVYQGDDTDCATVVCSITIGACCMPSGGCIGPRTAQDCVASGGVYQGDGTNCATVACPIPTGACCLASGECEGPMTAAECVAGGGSYRGNGTDCATITCPPPQGACCFTSPRVCRIRTAAACAAQGGTYIGDGTDCSPDPCPFPPGPTGACCVDGVCIGNLTRIACDNEGGIYRGDGTTCATPNICEIPTGCGGAAISSALSVFPLRESAGAASGSSSPSAPCALATSTNGTAANYRWYNICSGYIWIYSAWAQGEGVGVLFGGAQQPAVDGSNDVKRVITYFRNIVPNYNQTVDVHLDADSNGDGCPDQSLASALDVDPGLRWNCSEFDADIPCGVNYVIVRTVHDGGAVPFFATDRTDNCDPYAPGRSYYYGVGGSACTPWCGPDNTYDNFLYWLILDTSYPCIIAVEPTTWGKIKAMFR